MSPGTSWSCGYLSLVFASFLFLLLVQTLVKLICPKQENLYHYNVKYDPFCTHTG